MVLKRNALPTNYKQRSPACIHRVYLVPNITVWFSVASNRCRFAQNACFGREKEVRDMTSKASADLSDFLDLVWSRAISVPLTRENLHLVILFCHLHDTKRPSRLYLHLFILQRRVLYTQRRCSSSNNLSLIKKHPACAVYHQVLNLQVQVGPYLETPPWLRPIALFLLS